MVMERNQLSKNVGIVELDALLSDIQRGLDTARDLLATVAQTKPQEYLTVAEAARILGRSRSWVYGLHTRWETDIAQGVTPPHGLPFCYLSGAKTACIRRADLDALSS